MIFRSLKKAGFQRHKQVLEAAGKAVCEQFPVQPDQHIGDDGGKNLDQNGVFALAHKALDFEVLFEPFEQ